MNIWEATETLRTGTLWAIVVALAFLGVLVTIAQVRFWWWRRKGTR